MDEQVLKGVLPPVVLVLLALLWTKRKDQQADVGALAVGLGFGAAGVLLAGWPSWPPTSATEWLLPCVAAAGLVALFSTVIPGRVLFAILTALLMITASRFLYGGIPFGEENPPWSRWEPGEAAIWWIAGSVVLIALWVSTHRAAEVQPGPLPFLVLAGTAGAAAKVIMDGSSAKVAQYSGALACGLLILALPAFRNATLRLTTGLVQVAVLGVAGCLYVGYQFAYADALACGLVLCAPLSLWVGHRPNLREKRVARWLAVGGLFLVFTGLGLWRSYSVMPAPYDG